MRRKLFAATVPLAVLLFADCADAPTSPQRALVPSAPSRQASTVTENSIFPVSLFAFVPCVAGGGEFVELTGEIHHVSHVTISASGQLSMKVHDQPQGLTGVGQRTGTRYHSTGATQQMSHESTETGLPFKYAFVNNFHVIGQGQGSDFYLHQNLHVTVGADGTVTTNQDQFDVVCK